MRTRTWCVAAALACLPTLVAAQTVLSEAVALARLSAESPRVREIRSGVDVARAEALGAARWPNPRVTFNRESVATTACARSVRSSKTARVDRARAQAALAAFFVPKTDAATLVAAVPHVSTRGTLPSFEELVAHAESQLPELAALKREVESAEFAAQAASRRPMPEPEVVAGTKSSNAAGGDVGSVFSIHVAVPLFDRAKPEQALAEARRAQAEARIAAFQSALHAEVSALRTVVLDRRQAADRYRASTARSATELQRIAQVSYDAGERSILELVDAYRNSGATRLRQIALETAVRQAEIELELVSGWEIR